MSKVVGILVCFVLLNGCVKKTQFSIKETVNCDELLNKAKTTFVSINEAFKKNIQKEMVLRGIRGKNLDVKSVFLDYTCITADLLEVTLKMTMVYQSVEESCLCVVMVLDLTIFKEQSKVGIGKSNLLLMDDRPCICPDFELIM